ncbi:MAG: hypothetical protein IPN45_06355 [Actinomycetales bacterium]|nr:hypothetical protein [Actinomycetales bacterium]
MELQMEVCRVATTRVTGQTGELRPMAEAMAQQSSSLRGGLAGSQSA